MIMREVHHHHLYPSHCGQGLCGSGMPSDVWQVYSMPRLDEVITAYFLVKAATVEQMTPRG